MRTLRRAFPLVLVALILGGTSEAAKVVALHIRGYGGVGNSEGAENTPLPGDMAAAGTLGAEFGVSVLFFEGYASLDGYPGQGTVSRVILGVEGGLGKKWRLGGRAGVGLMVETGDVYGGDGEAIGVTARAGLSFDRLLGKGIFLGISVDTEAFALDGQGQSQDVAFGDGYAVTSSLRLSWVIGL